jgi:hypothetical protein
MAASTDQVISAAIANEIARGMRRSVMVLSSGCSTLSMVEL